VCPLILTVISVAFAEHKSGSFHDFWYKFVDVSVEYPTAIINYSRTPEQQSFSEVMGIN
jgi:hypothetical protein